MQVRVIAGGITVALLLCPLASAQKPGPPPVVAMQPDVAIAGTTQAAGDQLPDSPSAVQARLTQPQALAPGSNASNAQGSSQSNDLPDESSPGQPASSQTSTQASTPAHQDQQSPHEPVGTAAAETVQTTGVAASRPAGAALAPAKQRRARSILIKVGAIVGVGAAVATTWALSQGSPSKPPGTH